MIIGSVDKTAETQVSIDFPKIIFFPDTKENLRKGSLKIYFTAAALFLPYQSITPT